MRILIVEDDPRIVEPVTSALRSQRHLVDVALDGDSGLASCTADTYDLVVLDIMLPGIGGLEICKAMRNRGCRTMVLMMTARDAVRDKVAALDSGADDYIVKPFDLAELLARIRALSRRHGEGRTAILRSGVLELDQASARIFCAGKELDLTRTEYSLLEIMLRYPTRVFSAESLSERVARLEGVGSPRSIKSHVANLRKKLDAAGAGRNAIATVYGFGYRLSDV